MEVMPNIRSKDMLTPGEEQKLIEQLQAIAQTMRSPAHLDLTQLAWETQSTRIRNAAALALLALGVPQTAELMLRLLSRKDTKGARGTLLYVLNELSASVPLELLVDLLITENYEAQEEALTLLERARFDEMDRMSALAKLKPLKRSRDKRMSLLASEAVDLLKRT